MRLAFAALLLAALPAFAAPKPVDVVLCLDTSGSMDGLIDSAKRKLWAFVNDFARVEPMPTLRVALYSYGNNGYDPDTGWVRLEVALTTDLDEVYKKINALKTASAGSEEYPARVSKTAIERLQWADDKEGLRLLFVCGNEPVGQDPNVALRDVADLAKAKGVLVNAIYCGSAGHVDSTGWAAFATQCGGKFSNIDQDKPAIDPVVATPFDGEIAKLGGRLNETYLFYGTKGEAAKLNQVAQDRNAEKADAAVTRSITKAGRMYKNAECDLIDKMLESKDFDLTKVAEAELPEELRKLKPDDRLAHLKKKASEREAIQRQVTELTAKRDAYIVADRAKMPSPTGSEPTFDSALRKILKEQAEAKGLKLKD